MITPAYVNAHDEARGLQFGFSSRRRALVSTITLQCNLPGHQPECGEQGPLLSRLFRGCLPSRIASCDSLQNDGQLWIQLSEVNMEDKQERTCAEEHPTCCIGCTLDWIGQPRGFAVFTLEVFQSDWELVVRDSFDSLNPLLERLLDEEGLSEVCEVRQLREGEQEINIILPVRDTPDFPMYKAP